MDKPKKRLKRVDMNLALPANVQQIQANRAAAMIIRESKLNAMAVVRNNVNDRGFVDLASAGYACDTTGSVTLIATIAQGASVNQRVGKKVMYASIQIRGRFSAGATATLNDVAMIIVYDKRPTGALPAITDVLIGISATAMNNDDNSGRFQIVRRYDHILLGNVTTPATGRESVQADDFIKFRRPLVCKSTNTGAIGDIEEGALYAITVGSAAAGATAATLTASYRVRFTEN